jgi:hypothetical protein
MDDTVLGQVDQVLFLRTITPSTTAADPAVFDRATRS